MEVLHRKIIQIIEKDSKVDAKTIAAMLDEDEMKVQEAIHDMEKKHIIGGYHTIINWNKIESTGVTAMVELNVTPQGGAGFDAIAEKIYQFPQVEALYLMSGGYDFLVLVKANSLQEVAFFVSEHLASIEEVQRTATHFRLLEYKEHGTILRKPKKDGRMKVTL